MWKLLFTFGGWLLKSVFSAGLLQAASSLFLFFSIQAFITYGMGGDIFPEWATPQGFVQTMTTMKTSLLQAIMSLEYKTMFVSFSSMIFYLLDYLKVEYVIATSLNASITRFIIRRVFK